MGGVDKADMLLALYKTKCKTSKCYHRIAFHLFSLAVVNAWIVYREIGRSGALLPFLQQRSYSLIRGEGNTDDETSSNNSNRSLKRKHTPDYIRHDKKNHWSIQIDRCAQRCKAEGCQRKTRFYCKKCHIFLCINGSTCFLDFHNVE